MKTGHRNERGGIMQLRIHEVFTKQSRIVKMDWTHLNKLWRIATRIELGYIKRASIWLHTFGDTSARLLWTWTVYYFSYSVSCPGNWDIFVHFTLMCTLYINAYCVVVCYVSLWLWRDCNHSSWFVVVPLSWSDLGHNCQGTLHHLMTIVRTP